MPGDAVSQRLTVCMPVPVNSMTQSVSSNITKAKLKYKQLPGCEDEEIAVFERSIVKAANEILGGCGYRELSRLVCEYQSPGGVLILQGQVSSYYMKQVAQSVVRALEQVYEIRNNIDVVYP